MAELGEAAAGDEADPAGAEDPDRSRVRHGDRKLYLGERLQPSAIASIVSFESESRSVLTTQ